MVGNRLESPTAEEQAGSAQGGTQGAIAQGAAEVRGGKRTPDRQKFNGMLIVGLFAIALCVWAAVQFFAPASSQTVAVVKDGDGAEYRLPLNEDTTIEVATSLGTNIVRVQSGEVWVQEADCPHQDCVDQGKASKANQQIVCLPHKLTVTVVESEGTGSAGSGSLGGGDAPGGNAGDTSNDAASSAASDGAGVDVVS